MNEVSEKKSDQLPEIQTNVGKRSRTSTANNIIKLFKANIHLLHWQKTQCIESEIRSSEFIINRKKKSVRWQTGENTTNLGIFFRTEPQIGKVNPSLIDEIRNILLKSLFSETIYSYLCSSKDQMARSSVIQDAPFMIVVVWCLHLPFMTTGKPDIE